MTITENEHPIALTTREGIYLLGMTTTENYQNTNNIFLIGIYLLEMTATESLLRIQIFSRSVFNCLK